MKKTHNEKVTKEKAFEKHPIRSRSWVNEDAKSYGGAMLKAWYKEHPEYIDENS